MVPTWGKVPCVRAPEHSPVVAEPPPEPPTDDTMERPEAAAQAEGTATQMAEAVLREEVTTAETAASKDTNHPDESATDKDKNEKEDPVLDGEKRK